MRMPLRFNPDGTATLEDYSKSQPVVELSNRLKMLGVDLAGYLFDVTDFWNCSPKGFKFVCIDDKRTRELCKLFDLAYPKLVKDSFLSSMFQDGVSWREVSRQDSLHVIWLQGKPNESFNNPVVASYFNIHLDTVAICRANDKQRCELDWFNVPKHIWKDLWHK